MQIKLFLDENGIPRAEVGAACEALAGYLEQDVQAEPEVCRELLQQVEQVRGGSLPEWELTGNVYNLVLKPGKARIENLFSASEQPCELDLEEFGQAVTEWAAFVDRA